MSEPNITTERVIEELRSPTEEARAKKDELVRLLAPSLLPEMLRLMPDQIDSALARRGLTKDVSRKVKLLSSRSGDTRRDVLSKALNLYEMAMDAVEKKNRMAILDPDDLIVYEVTGISTADDSAVETSA